MGIKRPLLISLTALSVTLTGAFVNETEGSAKSYAKVTSIKSLGGDGNSRNVVVTGSNAIGTKALTLRGAQTVKSATALRAAQAADKTGNYNYRAYAVATTNTGSVYYKVVSFDKTVRGWIYGGQSTGTFAGGLQLFATASTPVTETKSYSYNGQNLWAEPAFTQYKVGASKLAMANGTQFTVNVSKKNVKSGDLYYQIADGNAKGAWIKARDFGAIASGSNPGNSGGGSVSVNVPAASNQVYLNFVEAGSSKSIRSQIFTNPSTEGVSAVRFLKSQLGGTSSVDSIPSNFNDAGQPLDNWVKKNINSYGTDGLSSADKSSNVNTLNSVRYGGAYTIYVQPLKLYSYADYTIGPSGYWNLVDKNDSSIIDLSTAVFQATESDPNNYKPAAALLQKLATATQGPEGTVLTGDQMQAALKRAGLETFYVAYDPAEGGGGSDIQYGIRSMKYDVYKFVFDKAKFDALPVADRTIGTTPVNPKLYFGFAIAPDTRRLVTAKAGQANIGELFEASTDFGQ
ncbi:hypothetical protein [uncultured Secundilactobacillus sp.]|uniref:hypothetical protein n=1 Tax=uncultured Secundilactobacillus sp. TaxID=2813935 RepID=UPI00258A79CD|nr:hypothetical protein [uncultured Secundilactobacillus sp.]